MFAVTDFFAVTAYTSFGIQHFFTPVCRANRIDTPSNAPVCYGHFRTIYARRRFSVGGPRSLISQCLSVGAYRTDGSADSNDVSWVRPGFGADKVQSDWSRTVHCHRGYTRRGAAGRRGFCVPPTFDFYRELINFRRTATVARARVRQKRFARCKKKKDTPNTRLVAVIPGRVCAQTYDYRSSCNRKKKMFAKKFPLLFVLCDTTKSNCFDVIRRENFDDDVTSISALRGKIWEPSEIW